MKKYLLILLLIAGCSNNPVDTTPPPSGETLLIDRTGITDSTTDGYSLFLTQFLDFQFSEIHITFLVKGDTLNNQAMVTLQKRSVLPYFFRSDFSSLNSSYIQFDTSFQLPSFSDTINAKLFTNSNIYWLAIRDLKIYGK